MDYYSAQYKLNDTHYSSFIYASSTTAALSFIKQRNIGEILIGVLDRHKNSNFNPQPLPSYLYRQRDLPACAHTLAFYCWIALRSNKWTHDDALCDIGVMHEVLHELEYPAQFPFRESLWWQLVKLESVIPGLNTRTAGSCIE